MIELVDVLINEVVLPARVATAIEKKQEQEQLKEEYVFRLERERMESTRKEIEADGFAIDRRVEMLLSSDTPVGVTKSLGLGIIGFADALEDLSPDLLLIAGDRYEIFAAASAAAFAAASAAACAAAAAAAAAACDTVFCTVC